MMLTTRTLFIACLFALVAACVAPSEFEEIDNTCDEPRFDVPTRDQFCSGEFNSEFVANVTTFQESFDDPPLVDVSDRWMTIAHIVRENQASDLTLRVKLHPRVVGGFDDVAERTSEVFLGESAQVDAIAMFGDIDSDAPTLAVVHDNRRSLSFVQLDGSDAVSTRSIEPELFAGDEARARAAACDAGREAIDEPGLRFADMAPFRSGVDEDRQYLIVAAGCGMAVFGQRPGFSPEVLVESSAEGTSVRVDEETGRLYYATGGGGLKVRTLAEIRQLADEMYDVEDVEASPAQCLEDDGCAGDYLFDPQRADESDNNSEPPSYRKAETNVTQVAAAGDRVYYINEATDDEADRGFTYLVTGTLNTGNALSQERSVALSGDDFRQREDGTKITYQLVHISDSIIAVLRRTEREDDDGEVTTGATITVFDAPDDATPVPAMTIPLLRTAEAIEVDGDKLLVFDADTVVRYDFTIGGSPL